MIESANQGSDSIVTTLASYTLGATLENLRYAGDYSATGAFRGQGNEQANRIEGGAGTDSLSGGLGNDTILGGAGDAGADTMDGGLGANTVSYQDAGAAVSVDLAGGVAQSSEGTTA